MNTTTTTTTTFYSVFKNQYLIKLIFRYVSKRTTLRYPDNFKYNIECLSYDEWHEVETIILNRHFGLLKDKILLQQYRDKNKNRNNIHHEQHRLLQSSTHLYYSEGSILLACETIKDVECHRPCLPESSTDGTVRVATQQSCTQLDGFTWYPIQHESIQIQTSLYHGRP
ncbi:hypothetical protein DFA_04085 [Cavenderia fasciculata]|uniref:Uncharacterized protein n=1 Tax=Cavenderia fasciculata TaxID=261658 RepID=F4Q190_CACFS|nr:uncharacterized protein DFA_04085 [Cavenderia fasciculata]EGG18591.1 hypothetical protein DFA_04085 [Cavenderia fasciculata]|eukprot:XP_004366495.1 hypothetical protein DFA_04085 [Cavenderia fasciculata]